MSMQASTTTQRVTGEELLQMRDVGPCELVEGEIKKISPTGWRHGNIEARLTRRLGSFVDENDCGEVMSGEVGIYTQRDPDTVRGADVLFISYERLEEASPEGFLDVAPELVVEIMSPVSTWEEVRRTIEEYFAIGVERVWIVEPENRAVQIYRSRDAVRTLTEDDVREGEDRLDGFMLPVHALVEE